MIHFCGAKAKFLSGFSKKFDRLSQWGYRMRK